MRRFESYWGRFFYAPARDPAPEAVPRSEGVRVQHALQALGGLRAPHAALGDADAPLQCLDRDRADVLVGVHPEVALQRHLGIRPEVPVLAPGAGYGDAIASRVV